MIDTRLHFLQWQQLQKSTYDGHADRRLDGRTYLELYANRWIVFGMMGQQDRQMDGLINKCVNFVFKWNWTNEQMNERTCSDHIFKPKEDMHPSTFIKEFKLNMNNSQNRKNYILNEIKLNTNKYKQKMLFI